MTPLVSIIIPCYNQADNLPNAIKAVRSQTLSDWECIVVDDGSTDNTGDIVKATAKEDSRFRYFRKENGGSASARDMGLKNAVGTYVQFLDADDFIASDKLARQSEVMQKNNLDISYTRFCDIYDDGKTGKEKSVKLNLYRILVSWGLGASTPINSFMYNRKFLADNNISFKSDCRYREDWRFHILCFAARPKVRSLTDYCGAMYYHSTGSKTSSYQKMQKGNFAFMAYMTGLLHGFQKLLWTLRISEELWIWLLRMVKYRSCATLKSISLMLTGFRSTLFCLLALLLMPVSLWWVAIYFIKTYMAR